MGFYGGILGDVWFSEKWWKNVSCEKESFPGEEIFLPAGLFSFSEKREAGFSMKYRKSLLGKLFFWGTKQAENTFSVRILFSEILFWKTKHSLIVVTGKLFRVYIDKNKFAFTFVFKMDSTDLFFFFGKNNWF